MLFLRFLISLLSFGVISCTQVVGDDPKPVAVKETVSACTIEILVLGVGQDAGAPQIGSHADIAWNEPDQRLRATSLGLVDRTDKSRYLFEAPPNIAEQLKHLDDRDDIDASSLDLSGIFITHAHIGHYAGLMFLGREAAGARNIPVYAMPRLSDYLKTNGPWEQLVSLENILLKEMIQKEAVVLSDRLSVTPYRVPHRDEYSETVGYKIQTADKSALFIPDIDSWDEWESGFNIKIEEMIASVDFAFLDATFYSNQELPGRDMSEIPHPRVRHMMNRFDRLETSEKRKIQFIHFNHTNPIRFMDSPESQEVASRGYNVARRGNKHCLLKE